MQTLYFSRFVLPISSPPILDGGIVVEEDRILDVSSSEQLMARYPEATPVNLGENVLLPGLVNAHLHLELTDAPPYQADQYQHPNGETDFIKWLIDLAKFQDQLSSEQKRDAIQKGLKQLVRSGVTTIADWTTYEGGISLYEESGLRTVLFPEVMNLNRQLTQDRFESALAMVEEILEKDSPFLRVGLAPYAPFTLSKNLLKILNEHIKQWKIPVQIHCSQTFAEMEFFYDSKGEIANQLFPYLGWGEKLPPPYQQTPVQYLQSIGLLQSKPALVGCIALAPADFERISETGSSVVACPVATRTLGIGSAHISKLKGKMIPVGLGSEHLGCNASLSLWDEMRELKKQKVSSEEVLKMATLGGAATLGLGDQIGSIEKGKKADFISVQLSGDFSIENILEKLIDLTTDDLVKAVWVNGKKK